MILGYHIIFSAYGFWLPNDPRGSWSDFVGSWDLYRAGGSATKTTETRSLAYDTHDRSKRLATKQRLQRPPVVFDDSQVRAIAEGFDWYVARNALEIRACAIMPDHIHLVTGPLRMAPPQLVIRLKGAATRHLIAADCHPFQAFGTQEELPPKCFAQGEWTAYLNSDVQVCRAIEYVERNPVKAGLPSQQWSFVRG